MLDLTETDHFSETIKIEIPGKPEAGFFTVHYRMIGRKKAGKLAKKSIEHLLGTVVIGWEDLYSKGETLPFSKDNLDRVIDHPVLGVLLFQSYIDAISGVPLNRIQVKN